MKKLAVILIAVMLAVSGTAFAEEDCVCMEDTQRMMEVQNPAGELSQLSFISGNKAFVKIFSGLSVADVTRLWNDLIILENDTEIRDVQIFINSPGGDAFSGLALADQIERARNTGL